MAPRNDLPAVTVVTGAAGGMGRAVVKRLLDDGHHVIGVVRSAADADELTQAMTSPRADVAARKAISSAPGTAAPVQPCLTVIACDLAVAAERRRIVDAIASGPGTITGLVNNAGVGMGSIRRDYYKNPIRLDELDSGIIERFMAVNATAPVALALELLPWFKRGWGRIVNVGTSLTAMLRPAFLPYAMSKAALESASAVLANDLQDSGITVNIVNPGGPVDTPMAQRDEPEFKATLIPADVVAAPTAWLVSAASAAIHGQRLTATRWHGPDAPLQTDPIGWPQLKGDSTWLSPYATGKEEK